MKDFLAGCNTDKIIFTLQQQKKKLGHFQKFWGDSLVFSLCALSVCGREIGELLTFNKEVIFEGEKEKIQLKAGTFKLHWMLLKTDSGFLLKYLICVHGVLCTNNAQLKRGTV